MAAGCREQAVAPHALAILVLVGCGGAGPPRGPAHTPASSPEPQTECTDQRDAAKTAREDSLEHPGQPARAAAASAVLAHAECEIESLARQTIPRSSQDALLTEIRILRDRYFTIRNLLDEVHTYEQPKASIGAHARTGDLEMTYFDKLDTAPPPVDLSPDQQEAFHQEMSDFGRGFTDEARRAYGAALDAAGGVEQPDRRLVAWIRAACTGLSRLDPQDARRRALCGRY